MRTPYKRCYNRYLVDTKPLPSRKPLLLVFFVSLFLLATPLAPLALTYGIFYIPHLLFWDFINCYESVSYPRFFDAERAKGKEEYEKITSFAPLLPIIPIVALIIYLIIVSI